MASSDKVSVVKDISIPEYMRRYIVPKMGHYYGSGEGQFAYRKVERCPVHDEDTASFRYYEETNTCYCFGCGFGGDVISLHRKFLESNEGVDCNFYDAVNFLYDVFVSGRVEADAGRKAGGNKQNVAVTAIAGNAEKASATEKKTESSVPMGLDSAEALRLNRKMHQTREKILTLPYESRYKYDNMLDLVYRIMKIGTMALSEAEAAVHAIVEGIKKESRRERDGDC